MPSRSANSMGKPLVSPSQARVGRALVAQVRREQHVEVIIVQFAHERHETRPLQHDAAQRIGKDLLLDAVTTIRVGVPQAVGGNAGRQVADFVAGLPLLLGDPAFAVGDDQAHVARAGPVQATIVDLVEDAVAEREPDPAGVAQRDAHAALGAAGPASRDARPARRVVVRTTHFCLVSCVTSSSSGMTVGETQLRPSRAMSVSASSGPQVPAG